MRRLTKLFAACAVALALLACESVTPFSSFHVPGIKPGASGAKDVEAKMGQPAEKITLSGGDAVWFYPRVAERQTVAVRLSPEGLVRSVEERLEPEILRKIVAGTATMAQVRELLGPPGQTFRHPRVDRMVWQYLVFDGMHTKQVVDLQFSADGVLREMNVTRDPSEISGAK